MIIILFLICNATYQVAGTSSSTVAKDKNLKVDTEQAAGKQVSVSERDSIKTVVDHVAEVLENIQLDTLELESKVPNLRPLSIGGDSMTNRNLTFEDVTDEIEILKTEMENLKFSNNLQKLLIDIEQNDRNENDKLLMRWVFKLLSSAIWW